MNQLTKDGILERPSALQPANIADRLTNRGVELAGKGKRDEALDAFHQAVLACPHFAKAQHNLGVALAERGQPKDALPYLEEALRLKPDYVDAHYNLGNVLSQLKRSEDAIASYRLAIRHKPDHPQSLNNLGLALTLGGKPGEAIILLKQALRLHPDFPEALNNLGLALADIGAFREAEKYFEQALDLNPGHAEAHNNLGNLYKDEGREEQALACYDISLRIQPDSVSTQWNRALTLLQTGDYGDGWVEYEWRLRKPDSGVRPFREPRWDGGPLSGRSILLHMEQGHGDMLQFIRFARLVKRQNGTVLVACPASLVSLFSSAPGVDQAFDERGDLPSFDVQAPLLSLPYLLKSNLTTIPSEGPYLSPPLDQVRAWKKRLEGMPGLKVGICWQGNPRHAKDRQRSAPLHWYTRLARVPGVHLVSLQCGHGFDQLAALHGQLPIVEVLGDAPPATWGETAALVQSLDLVISVDTAVAHLAGALGVPTWVALSLAPDWRWLRDRHDSPWYPTLRLFRQNRWGDWKSVFGELTGALRELASRDLSCASETR